MGGSLEPIAKFPGGEVAITQLVVDDD